MNYKYLILPIILIFIIVCHKVWNILIMCRHNTKVINTGILYWFVKNVFGLPMQNEHDVQISFRDDFLSWCDKKLNLFTDSLLAHRQIWAVAVNEQRTS
jgi:hypothetical protein